MDWHCVRGKQEVTEPRLRNTPLHYSLSTWAPEDQQTLRSGYAFTPCPFPLFTPQHRPFTPLLTDVLGATFALLPPSPRVPLPSCLSPGGCGFPYPSSCTLASHLASSLPRVPPLPPCSPASCASLFSLKSSPFCSPGCCAPGHASGSRPAQQTRHTPRCASRCPDGHCPPLGAHLW